MTRLGTAGLALGLGLALLAPRGALACGATDVCSDVLASFSGTYILEGIRVQWSSDDEDASVASYVVSRYNCSTPASCLTGVVQIGRVGSCGTTQPYAWADNPPDPDSQWTYRIEVLAGGSPACTVDVLPQ